MTGARYSIVQFCPNPERFEALNVGVLILDDNTSQPMYRFLKDFSRLRKVFGGINKSFLNDGLEDFVQRVVTEYRGSKLFATFDQFAASRTNIFRLSPLQPILNDNLDEELDNLFSDLVDGGVRKIKAERIKSRVNKSLAQLGLLQFLDRKPNPVKLDRYGGVTIKAEYGYQNGAYNLVDVARFDDAENGLAEAGKRALEGNALAGTLDKRLSVIGDFGDLSENYYSAIKEDLLRANVKLYRLSDSGLQEFSRAVRYH